MSVCPAGCWERTSKDSDAAVAVTEYVDNVRGDILDAVDEDVGRSCVRSGLAEVWPGLHDERSVMSFLVRPVGVLTGQLFYRMKLVMIVSHPWWMVIGRLPVLWTWTPQGWISWGRSVPWQRQSWKVLDNWGPPSSMGATLRLSPSRRASPKRPLPPHRGQVRHYHR